MLFRSGIAGLDVLAEEDGWLRIGALVRHGDLERSDLVRERYPIVHDAAQHVADPLIRNRGTFCGSLAHGDPAGDWATVAATLGAELHAVGPDGAVVHSARGFQTSMFETQLGTDQILVEARVPAPKPGQGSAYLKVERKVGDYAAAAVGVMVVLDGDTITEASIGLTNVGPETIHATAAGDAVRDILLHRREIDLAPTTEMLLYMAARAQLVAEVIAPALARGAWVVSDRFLVSNVVYQGHGGGLPPESIRRVGEVATAGTLPDRVILLDIDPAVAAARLARPLDRLESRGDDYRRRLRDGYLHEAAADPGRIRVVDADAPPDEVAARIRAAVSDLVD